jgi:hypothetical protein
VVLKPIKRNSLGQFVSGVDNLNRTHGLWRSREYNSWDNMIQRCSNPHRNSFKSYGAKGVRVCERWKIFSNFYQDMGPRPEGYTLDRINPFGQYEPINCRWVDKKTQLQNTRRNYVRK